MKIGLFGPFSLSQRRGNSIRVLRQAKGLLESGFKNFEVFGYGNGGPGANGVRRIGVRVVPKMLPVGQKIDPLPVDLVHVHHFYGAMVLRQRYILDMPSIISKQIEQMYRKKGPIWKRIFLRSVLNPLYIRRKEVECIQNAEAVIVASEEIKRNLLKLYGLGDLTFYVVNNTVERTAVRKSCFTGKFSIGLAASDFRDCMDAGCLDILSKAAERKPAVRFVVAGRTSLRQRKLLMRLPNVELLGALPHEVYISFLDRISVFLMPYFDFYDYGGSKFKLLDAGARQIPVICSSFGAIGFDHKDRLCMADSVDEICSWIDRLSGPAVRRQYGHALYEIIKEQFDYKREAQKLIEIYRRHVH